MANISIGSVLAHGGALHEAMREYGGVEVDWLDLSTGINPNPLSIPKIDPSVFARLPEAHHYDDALHAAKLFYNATGEGLLAAGTQPIIAQLPSLIGGQTAQILGPTYGEYARVLSEANIPFEYVDQLENLTASWCFVVNPDNPSGRKIGAERLIALANHCAEQGGCLVVDEAFADLDIGANMAAHTGMNGLIVLRSFGKFFGLAGIRLAAAFGPSMLIEHLKTRIGPWPVSGPALAIGTTLYRDRDAQQELRQSISSAHDQTRYALISSGFEIMGDAGLFLTIKHPKALAIHEALKAEHVLTRVFDYRSDWLRFGLCKNKQEVNILIQRLKVLNQVLDI